MASASASKETRDRGERPLSAAEKSALQAALRACVRIVHKATKNG